MTSISVIVYDVGELPREETPINEVDAVTQTTEGSVSSDEGEEVSTEVSTAEPTKIDVVSALLFDWREAFKKKEMDMRNSGTLFDKVPPKPQLTFITETGEVMVSFD